MSTDTPEPTPEQFDNKELRLEHPSGWLYLTMNDSVPIIVDALLGLPPREEFNKTELADCRAFRARALPNTLTDLSRSTFSKPSRTHRRLAIE